MERDSFIFYKSFYEAISELPKDIRLEVLTAIIEYGLYGRLPESLKPFARGMFTLIKPNLDANITRFENGSKGGRKPSAKKKAEPAPEASASYSTSYEQEVERMRNDLKWRKTICADFKITVKEYAERLARFLTHCTDDKARKGKPHHDSYTDCQSHFRYWMSKAYPATSKQSSETPTAPPASDYSFKGGFGGQDI